MTDEAMSPLRRRMIEDMTIRKLAPKTQHDYVQRIKDFAAFLSRSPATASKEDVRRYQLHLTSSGARTPKINSTVSALRFFFDVTLDRADLAKQASFVHEPRKLPLVLSPQEVARLLEAAFASFKFCLAEKERAMIAVRTKDALARAKARGVKLGGPKLTDARKAAAAAIEAAADQHAAKVLPIVHEIQRAGAKSLKAIADALNARGVSTARGGRWHAMTVSNLVARSG